MLTPAFEIIQDKVYLTFIIKAPYAKVSDAEIFIEDDEFRFFSKPYFLRLSLPGCLIEDGRENAKYNSDDGSFTVTVPKATEGEVFEGLDMLTKLLTPKGQTSAASPLIQVLDSSENSDKDGELDIDEDFDWHVDQKVYVEEEIPLDSPKYGFASTRCGVFKQLQEDIVDVVSLPDPDGCGVMERRDKRTHTEQDKFDPDYYLADLYEDDMIQELLNYNASWENQSECSDKVSFTDTEKEAMRNLPKKEYLIEDELSVYLGLVDILFAYAYNHRTTQGEDNVESAWTICTLSATLSWLDVFHSLEEVVVSSYRRSLCYPLYRQWNLSSHVLHDTQQILRQGKTGMLKCLLEVKHILSHSYPCYILNDLYITDYCVWIQTASKKKLASLSDTIAKISIQKDMIGFNLSEIEQAAEEENDPNVEAITESVSQIGLHHDNPSPVVDNDSDDDSTDSESSDEESDTDSAESEHVADGRDKNSQVSETSTENCDKNTKDGDTSKYDDTILDNRDENSQCTESSDRCTEETDDKCTEYGDKCTDSGDKCTESGDRCTETCGDKCTEYGDKCTENGDRCTEKTCSNKCTECGDEFTESAEKCTHKKIILFQQI